MVAALLGADRRLRLGVLAPALAAVLVGWIVLTFATDHASVASFSVMWLAMSVAMMVPTVARPMLRAADGSAARAWTFLAGFVLVWLLAGLPAYLLMNAITWTPFWISLAWIVAGVYQSMPAMHRLVRSCRSVAYSGSPASYGMRQGLRCVASCAPVMLAAMVTAMVLPGFIAPVALLLGLTVLLCWEREPSTSRQALIVVGMVMMLAAVAGMMLFGGGAGHLHS
jgi:predicted metal-binding membrane protein